MCCSPSPFFRPPRWHLSKRPEAGLSIHAISKHFIPVMGLVVPSPSAPLPVDRLRLLQAHPNCSSCTSGSSGSAVAAAGTTQATARANPVSPTEKVKSHGNERGKLGGRRLFGGRVPAANHPFWRESWSLGTLEGLKQSTTEPSNRPIAPVQPQSAAQPASNQQAISGTELQQQRTKDRLGQHLATTTLHRVPCSLLDFHRVSD